MKAVCWNGKKNISVEEVPDPRILSPRDAVIRITSTAICGSDLHLYDGYIPTMHRGDILGHEFMGEVVDTGSRVSNLRIGDRVVVPFAIACGACYYCQNDLPSLCDNANPNASEAEAANGFSGAGMFGYSHMYGGYAGGQAEYVRVPYADFGPLKLETDLSDEDVLFLSDIFPTGYMAADYCEIQSGDIVAVWGCGPVGQFAIRSALVLGASRVIAIDRFPERLNLASKAEGDVVTINYEQEPDVIEIIKQLTGGSGADSCIDAVGMEAHGTTFDALIDRAKAATMLTTDRLNALRQAIQACKKNGTVSIVGVYAGFPDKFPLGAAFAKGLKFRMGQCHVHRYMRPLLKLVEEGKIKPSEIISHRVTLEEAPEAYRSFRDKEDGCIKFVLKP